MIQANELRIGNWVNLKSSGYVRVEVDSIGDIVNNPAIFEPIPLAPKILEKAGFTERQQSFFSYYFIDYIQVAVQKRFEIEEIDDRPTFLWMAGNNIIHIHYLHQLQNLYHALTGRELEIDL